jgi:hypothetical protein
MICFNNFLSTSEGRVESRLSDNYSSTSSHLTRAQRMMDLYQLHMDQNAKALPVPQIRYTWPTVSLGQAAQMRKMTSLPLPETMLLMLSHVDALTLRLSSYVML